MSESILFRMNPETKQELENQRLQRKARKLERRATRQASKLSKMIDELTEDEALYLAEIILAEALSSAEGLRKVVDVLARIEDAIESFPADEQGNIPVPAHCWVNKKTGQMADTQAHDEIVRGNEDALKTGGSKLGGYSRMAISVSLMCRWMWMRPLWLATTGRIISRMKLSPPSAETVGFTKICWQGSWQ